MKTGSPGTLKLALTDAGHVLLTVSAEDGTEVNMAMSWSAWVGLTGKLSAVHRDDQIRRSIDQRDRLAREAREALE